MKINELFLKGAYVIESKPLLDERGFFKRLYCVDEFQEILKENIVQINYSLTKRKGSIRGMHFQKPPKTEIKIIQCIKGKVYDVIVDIRKNSDTFLKWHGEILSKEDNKMIFVPKGFAHGFQTIENDSELLYFHTTEYAPEFEDALNYNDPIMGINWPEEITTLSDKDNIHKRIDKNFNGLDI